MSKIVKTFFILLILSPIFAIQQKSDELPQLPNTQNRSQVNTLAKIIVDENGKITIEQITNDLNNESTDKTSLINKEVKDVDPQSIDEDSDANSAINANFESAAGYHSLTWDATNDYGDQVSAGVYFYQLQTKEFVKTRKMILLK